MSKALLTNICLNVLLAVILFSLNNWALYEGLEETFVSIALFMGVLGVLLNALWCVIVIKNTKKE